MPKIADRIKELRKSKGLSQREVGEAIGITERSYRRYEAGDMDPSATNIVNLADFFGVSADYLLGRTNHWQDDSGNIKV
ncbi:MAG: helix-turn-helix domain-containing protein [Defluviitaleaceae bacterium]|nr:helix-turn-helix domain-containing protein [Defluviitaleaceae bacterium]